MKSQLQLFNRCIIYKKHCLLALVILSIYLPASAQTRPASAPPIRLIQHPGDYDSIYTACRQAAPDNVHRVCIVFLRSHGIRKFPEEFARFCEYAKTRCKKENNQPLYRRMALIEMIGQLSYQKATPEQADIAFENLYNNYADEGDYSAALETLFELAQFQHHASRNIQAIKVLFFAEKIATKYKLEQDITYQAILHKIGYILWELDKLQPSTEYFKRSLATGKGITMDSLVALNGIGINYQKMDSLAESMRYFNKASAAAVAANNHVFNTVILGSAAVTQRIDSARLSIFW